MAPVCQMMRDALACHQCKRLVKKPDPPADLFVGVDDDGALLSIRRNHAQDHHLLWMFLYWVKPNSWIHFVNKLEWQRTRVPPIQLGVHVEQLLIREDPNKAGGLWTLKNWEAACSSQDAWPLLIAAYFGSLLIPCVSFHRSILSSMSWKSWICLPFFLIDCHEFFSISLDTVATFLRILIDRGRLDLGVSSLKGPQLELSPRLIEQLTEKCCNIRQFALDQAGISCCAQTASDNMSFRLFSHD